MEISVYLAGKTSAVLNIENITRAQQQLRWATVATIDMGRKEGAAVPVSRGAGIDPV